MKNKTKTTHILPKMITAMLVSVLCLLSFCLFACFEDEDEKVGPIPNGFYYLSLSNENSSNATTYNYVGDMGNHEFGLKVNGDRVFHYVSRYLDYKAKIAEKEDAIYFEGYTWVDCAGKEGDNRICKVEYNEETKQLLVHWDWEMEE